LQILTLFFVDKSFNELIMNVLNLCVFEFPVNGPENGATYRISGFRNRRPVRCKNGAYIAFPGLFAFEQRPLRVLRPGFFA